MQNVVCVDGQDSQTLRNKYATRWHQKYRFVMSTDNNVARVLIIPQLGDKMCFNLRAALLIMILKARTIYLVKHVIDEQKKIEL